MCSNDPFLTLVNFFVPYAKGVTLCIRFHLAYWNQGAQSSYYHSVIMWFWAKFSIIFCWNWEKVFSAITLYPYPVKLVEVMPWLFGICWMIFNAAVVEYHCYIWLLTSSIFQFLLLFTAVWILSSNETNLLVDRLAYWKATRGSFTCHKPYMYV